MKKKLTVGVFLSLAVVLVASIVGVGIADAAKPVRTVTPSITVTPIGTTGNCSLTAEVPFQGYNAWGWEVWWRYYEGQNHYTVEHTKHYFDGGRTTSGTLELILTTPQTCGANEVDYDVYVELIRKNGRSIRGAFGTSARGTCECPSPP